MRTPSIYTRQRTGLDIPMTPLIDVVFQLLVFFLLTASFHAAEHLLPSSVSAPQASGTGSPTETPPPEDDFDQVVVRILWVDGQPAWQVNGQMLGGLTEVRNTLAAVARVKADAPVILHPDPEVPLGHVIDVYDVTRLVGFPQVQFAAGAGGITSPSAARVHGLRFFKIRHEEYYRSPLALSSRSRPRAYSRGKGGIDSLP